MAKTQAFLVEIGTEELPPKALKELANHLLAGIWRALDAHRFIPDVHRAKGGEFFFSPRRLAVYIPYVFKKQPLLAVKPVAGPTLEMAFDTNNRPTKAAEGFARKFNVLISELIRKDGRLYFQPKPFRMDADKYLPQAVMGAIQQLPVGKRMRWGTGEIEFVRPVHWVVMLLGSRALRAEILGVKSGNKTYGHRYHHPGAIALKYPEGYRKALAVTGKVLVEDRAGTLTKKIATLVNQAAKRVRGKAQLGKTLLEEVAALVEWPVPITGAFDGKFLALPEEVIVAVLETQQRYFPLRDAQGRLLPKFVAISNIQSKRPAEVQRGNERVIVPRLTDAMFFWNNDRKSRLESRIPELDRMVFQKELGSYGDKSKRVAQLAARIAREIGSDSKLAERAAQLCKCDLVTGMVGEFPELQGVMGGHYARHDGEPEEVARAVAEHYRPRFADDALPETKAGQALAIADKLDTITGIFSIGQKPTGDKDPFALRRAGLGLMRTIIESQLPIVMAGYLREAVQTQPVQKGDQQKLIKEIYEFLLDRLRSYFLEVGIRADVYDAVRACSPGKPLEFQQRIQALNAFLMLPEATSLAAANKRIGNILRQADYPESQKVQDGLLREPTELALYEKLTKLDKDARELAHHGDYGGALKKLAALREPVDSFFDKVLVMDPDTALRNNRLALLQRIRESFLRIADISLLQVE